MSSEINNALPLVADIKLLIEESKQRVAVTVNAAMSLLYWEIGYKINEGVLLNKRAEYGSSIVSSIAKQLTIIYGDSFSEKNLRRMMQFANVFDDKAIVVSVIRQLSWTHILALLPMTDPLKRSFYAQLCVHEKWSVRVFRERINSML